LPDSAVIVSVSLTNGYEDTLRSSALPTPQGKVHPTEEGEHFGSQPSQEIQEGMNHNASQMRPISTEPEEDAIIEGTFVIPECAFRVDATKGIMLVDLVL